jgi:hypothetical protein
LHAAAQDGVFDSQHFRDSGFEHGHLPFLGFDIPADKISPLTRSTCLRRVGTKEEKLEKAPPHMSGFQYGAFS